MVIREGDVFQVMRMILPEHRSAMSQWSLKYNEKAAPTLTEDEFIQMQYTLSEAVEQQTEIRVTLYGKLGNTILEGTPLVREGNLSIVVDGERHNIPLDKIIAVEHV